MPDLSRIPLNNLVNNFDPGGDKGRKPLIRNNNAFIAQKTGKKIPLSAAPCIYPLPTPAARIYPHSHWTSMWTSRRKCKNCGLSH